MVKLTNPPPSRLIKNCVEPPPKNIQGIGTTTYMSAESIGHQLLYKAHAWPLETKKLSLHFFR